MAHQQLAPLQYNGGQPALGASGYVDAVVGGTNQSVNPISGGIQGNPNNYSPNLIGGKRRKRRGSKRMGGEGSKRMGGKKSRKKSSRKKSSRKKSSRKKSSR